MTKAQQRISIAKARGWKWLDHPDTLDRTKTFQLQNKWVLSPDDKLELPHNAPDYLNDLNAMHEAVASLTPSQRSNFCVTLNRITGQSSKILGWQYLIHTTAEQRAEAFLEALDL
jgi:hypothetical protein